jgi:hypothetical protein
MPISTCIIMPCTHTILCVMPTSTCIIMPCTHTILCVMPISTCIIMPCTHTILCAMPTSTCIIMPCTAPAGMATWIVAVSAAESGVYSYVKSWAGATPGGTVTTSSCPSGVVTSICDPGLAARGHASWMVSLASWEGGRSW